MNMPEETREQKNSREWRDTKRHAGCLWSCLSEPFVVAALVIASLFGAYTFGRNAERARLESERREQSDREQADD